MKRLPVAVLLVLVVAIGVVMIVVLPRTSRPQPDAAPGQPSQAASTPAPERKITATLFYVAGDGVSLTPEQAEVPFGEPVSMQARHIVEAQIAAPTKGQFSAIPQGTRLRALYVNETGDAFVDLTGEIVSGHTGGVLDELFAVYAIVNAITVNLPAITRVQLLIDGKEVDTLAGHVDLRQPLAKNLTWVVQTKPEEKQ